MLTHEEMIGLQAEKHELVDAQNFQSREQYVLHLIHTFAYTQVARIVSGKKVLDLGCNTGYGSDILSKNAQSVIGVDVSEDAINLAKSSYPALTFHLSDGKKLPFHDNEFDLIISCQVIEHIVDHNIYFSELKRVLKDTGIAIFTTPNAILRLDPGMKPWNEFHVQEFSAKQLKNMLEEHFKAISILGLSASDKTYNVEKQRLDRARNAARDAIKNPPKTKKKNVFKEMLKTILPNKVIDIIKHQNKSTLSEPKNLDTSFINEHHLDDLFYINDSHDDALDLMAICSMNETESLDNLAASFKLNS